VTGISQPGGSYFIGVGIREGIVEGIVEGPRMTTAGRFITTSNGISDWYPSQVGVPQSSIGVLADTTDEMIREVRHQVKNGVDFIKLADSPFGGYQSFTDEEVATVTALAPQLGRRVTIHARGSAEVRASVAAGVDWIMHGNVMTDDVIADLASSGTLLVPTLLLLANLADFGHLVGTPIVDQDACRRMLDLTADTLHRAHKAGVRFGMGTDTGFSVTPFGEWHARELELLVTYAGLSNMEAICAATANNAVTLGLDGEVGVIATGALADIVIVDGDPARDVRVLQDLDKVDVVLKGGRVVAFSDEELVVHPYDRSIIYSTKDLTRAVVRMEGAAEAEAKPDVVCLPPHEAKALVRELQDLEAGASARGPWGVS
jgi:imidazolonepropionase-like amidohydrolase